MKKVTIECIEDNSEALWGKDQYEIRVDKELITDFQFDSASNLTSLLQSASQAVAINDWVGSLVAKKKMDNTGMRNLNAWQRSSLTHPYTCGNNRTDANHLDREGVLVATENGWICPYCDYSQPYRFDAHEIKLAKTKPADANILNPFGLKEIRKSHDSKGK